MLDTETAQTYHDGETALTIVSDMTIDDWADAGHRLAEISRNHQFKIGDWCAYGEDRFGDAIKPYLPGLGLEIAQVRKAAKIARQFPPHERNAQLSYKHYEFVSALPYGEARKLLETAIGKPAKELRVEVAHAKEQCGIIELLNDDDQERREFLAIMWAYNRASPAAREYFMESVPGNFEDIIIA